jgi:hypothetical protein
MDIVLLYTCKLNINEKNAYFYFHCTVFSLAPDNKMSFISPKFCNLMLGKSEVHLLFPFG